MLMEDQMFFLRGGLAANSFIHFASDVNGVQSLSLDSPFRCRIFCGLGFLSVKWQLYPTAIATDKSMPKLEKTFY